MLYLNFPLGIDGNSAQALMSFLSDQVTKGVKEFYILFSSPGGSVRDGVVLHNFLKALPAKVVMHNIGIVDSIANVVFLGANERYANPHSSFLFHGVGFDIEKARFEEKELKERMIGIQRDQNLIAQIIAERTKITQDEVRQMFWEAKTKTPQEAKAAGIVNEVKEAKIPDGTQVASLRAK